MHQTRKDSPIPKINKPKKTVVITQVGKNKTQRKQKPNRKFLFPNSSQHIISFYHIIPCSDQLGGH